MVARRGAGGPMRPGPSHPSSLLARVAGPPPRTARCPRPRASRSGPTCRRVWTRCGSRDLRRMRPPDRPHGRRRTSGAPRRSRASSPMVRVGPANPEGASDHGWGDADRTDRLASAAWIATRSAARSGCTVAWAPLHGEVTEVHRGAEATGEDEGIEILGPRASREAESAPRAMRADSTRTLRCLGELLAGQVVHDPRLRDVGREADDLGPGSIQRQEREHALVDLRAILEAATAQHDANARSHHPTSVGELGRVYPARPSGCVETAAGCDRATSAAGRGHAPSPSKPRPPSIGALAGERKADEKDHGCWCGAARGHVRSAKPVQARRGQP